MTAFKLSQIVIYPVKSLGGMKVTEAAVEARGLRHDRRWMLTDPGGRFLTQRSLPRMALIQPMLEADYLTLTAPGLMPLQVPLISDGPVQHVEVWRSVCDAVDVGADAAAWFECFLGMPCRLNYMPDTSRRAVNPEYRAGEGIVSFADGYPLLLLGENSLVDLNSRLDEPVPMDRFRPNFVVSGSPAYAEDDWTRVRIGPALFHGVKACDRCVLTTINQTTGEQCGPEPLRTLATYRLHAQKVLFGRYLISGAPAQVQTGDVVEVLASAG